MSEKEVIMSGSEWVWALDELPELDPVRIKIEDQLPDRAEIDPNRDYDVYLTPIEAAAIGE